MLLLLALAAPRVEALPPAPDDPAALEFATAIEKMAGISEQLQSCTYTLHSVEYIGGKLGDPKQMTVKFRRDLDVVLQFGGAQEGRVVLYRGPDWNEGRFRVDPGGFAPKLSLHPDGRLAKRGNRHTIQDAPMTALVDKIVGDAERVRDHQRWKPDVKDLGTDTLRGEPTHCYESTLPKGEDPTLYAHKVKICIHPETGLPNGIRVWDIEDGELRMVEQYEYIDVRINPGLSDADFAPETYGL